MPEATHGRSGPGLSDRGAKAPIGLLAIDLYNCVFPTAGDPGAGIGGRDERSCGIHATQAIAPIEGLLALGRRNGFPIIYTTSARRSSASPIEVGATRRRHPTAEATAAEGRDDARDYEILPNFRPEAGEPVVEKLRASAFFGTDLLDRLEKSRIKTVVMCGESTSGCVRASAVDAFSHGFDVIVVEDCVFDRNLISHKVNLFDLHQKYAEVVPLATLRRHLAAQ